MCRVPGFSSHTMKIAVFPAYFLIAESVNQALCQEENNQEKKLSKKGPEKKKKTQMLTSYHLLIGLFLKNLLKVLCWPVPPPLGVRMWEKKPHWLTHETHYQKLSILTVKATEAICTLLRSLLHFDNCFSPWTVEF